jgi:hypothetical protein
MKVICILLQMVLNVAEEDFETRNPLTITDYGNFEEISWYGWVVIVYSLFVVVIIGSAIFFP